MILRICPTPHALVEYNANLSDNFKHKTMPNLITSNTNYDHFQFVYHPWCGEKENHCTPESSNIMFFTLTTTVLFTTFQNTKTSVWLNSQNTTIYAWTPVEQERKIKPNSCLGEFLYLRHCSWDTDLRKSSAIQKVHQKYSLRESPEMGFFLATKYN